MKVTVIKRSGKLQGERGSGENKYLQGRVALKNFIGKIETVL